MRKPPVRETHQKDKPNEKQQGKRGRKRKKHSGGNGKNVFLNSNERNRMPCKSCGQKSQSSLAAEREREARAIKRRKQTEQAKAQFMTRRADLVAQVKAQREAARNR